MTKPTLYLFGSAAPPVHDVARVIEEAQTDGWDVCLGLTPTAARWLGDSLDALGALTGHPVRWEYRMPGQPDVWPKADAILVAPATFNTINAWALGITDKWLVGVVAEGIGKLIPMAMVPCVNRAYVAHPQFNRSIDTLWEAGVRVLYGEGGFVPNAPGRGNPDLYPWRAALDAVADVRDPASNS
ncbi:MULTISPECIES: flavoprotein [Streptomyces]|uniref:Flavoprotein n=1 Tax=Streptomyces cavourensis TaxID=67258 RepID=A0ABY5FAC8_9ACTN|nr:MULTISPECIES: flavoprotein [Streptomyces]UTR80621.1 flavoprotein [Streptomyces cavourensis]WST13397.1 flavoprotein [Streptomyces microflavus]SCK27039.1 Phosphopantothenoylcysteine synthetase/decarboxylase [Streptomyces sp. ScaeMP-e48]